jgi:hypothetical protein
MTKDKAPTTKGKGQMTKFCHWNFVIGFYFVIGIWSLAIFAPPAWAEVAIETSVSRSRLAVGEELTLDIIVTNAEGKIERPVISSIEGFSSYSQGHSQEISIVNGRSSSRSVFSYTLVANAEGRKKIGPFTVTIGGKNFKIAAVEVEILPAGSSLGSSSSSFSRSVPSGPVFAPPPKALPSSGISNQDIFVKAWLDKDEVYVNEPAMLTYTVYTRLSATYKGFEKEPVTTGFWVEDFPPEKTIRRTEQIFNGSRYVVADVRKLALFPTQAGVFTIEPGVLSANVEVRERDNFDSFFSANIFGARSSFGSPFVQVFSKSIPADPLTLSVKALPEAGKPAGFNGAVGDYRIESSIDKSSVEEGNPVTYRVRIKGEGNINTLQPPALAPMNDFKIYDSSSSANISKNRLIVEGEKVTETVLVPKKAGTYAIPALEFSYFDPKSKTYKQLKTSEHPLTVKPGAEESTSAAVSFPSSGATEAEKQEVAVLAKDIRYIKTQIKPSLLPAWFSYRHPFYWPVCAGLLGLSMFLMVCSVIRQNQMKDVRGFRFRRGGRVARRRLKTAGKFLQKGQADAFYTELDRAIHGYFADKLNIPAQAVNLESLEEKISPSEPVWMDIKSLFEELSLGRFANAEQEREAMSQIYQNAGRVITLFEKVKLK